MTAIWRHRLIRYGIVGACVAGFYLCVYLGLLAAGLTRVPANLIAFALAVGVSYLGQTVLTFERSTRDAGQALRFAIMVSLGFATSAIITSVIGPGLGLPDWVSAAVVTMTLPLQNYVFMRFWVYARPQEGQT